jgi:phage shock protein PspC (stress-responsive transcriptional regulator)
MTEPTLPSNENHPLRRRYGDRLIAGVGSGIAEYLDIDVAVVRLAFVALTLVGGVGVPIYAAAWLFVPAEGSAVSVAADLLNRHQPI